MFVTWNNVHVSTAAPRGEREDEMETTTTRNEAQHTPGPWQYEPSAPERRWGNVVDRGGGLIASAVWSGDAHLIAAAPEMLVALRACFANGDPADGFDPENARTEQMVRDAIAKAEGREP